MSPAKLEELIECFGLIFAQIYAATEVPIFVSALDKAGHEIARTTGSGIKHLSSAGRATPGVEVYITDEQGKPLPTGQCGEIRIRSRAVIKGYYNNPETTAAEFSDGAWKSGDLGYIDEDGYLYIVDRLKDMIISGGFNVYAIEVEAALASHPAVMMAAVVGIPHPEWGEAVHAEVVLRPGATVEAAELIAHVKERLGSYKAPKSLVFVRKLPTSVVGKVLRRAVRKGTGKTCSARSAKQLASTNQRMAIRGRAGAGKPTLPRTAPSRSPTNNSGKRCRSLRCANGTRAGISPCSIASMRSCWVAVRLPCEY